MKTPEWYTKWKAEHPTAYRRALLVLAGALLAALAIGGAKRAFGASQDLTLRCQDGTFVAMTGLVVCVPTGATIPPGGGTTPPPVTEFEGCPTNALKSKTFYPVKDSGDTSNIGKLSATQVMSLRMQIPSTAPTTTAQMYFSGTYGGAPGGAWAISEKACDFDTPIIDTINSKPAKVPPKIVYMKGYLNPGISGSYTYGGAGTGGITKTMEIGRTYYLNIRVDTCIADGGCWWDGVKFP